MWSNTLLASSDPAFLEPLARLSAYPIQRFKIGLECVDLLDCAVRPFGLDLPLLAVA